MIMTAMFAFLGAIPLRALKTLSGSLLYWLLGFVITGALAVSGQHFLAVPFGAMYLVVGIFSELEDMELTRGWAAFWSLSIGTLVVSAGVLFWRAALGETWYPQVLALMQVPVDQFLKINSESTLTAEDLLRQAPAVFLVLTILALYMAVLFENRVLKLMRSKLETRNSLKKFKVADVFLWLFLASLLGVFLKHEFRFLQTVAMNVLFVTLFLYFLQGLAVVADTFAKLKVNLVWQLFGYLVLVTQLMLLLCMVGLADFWFDFRTRGKNKPQENLNREIF